MVTGWILNRWHKYVVIVRILAWLTFILTACASATFATKDVLIVGVSFVVCSCFMIPIIPVSIDFASELTFPNDGAVVTGFLLMSA